MTTLGVGDERYSITPRVSIESLWRNRPTNTLPVPYDSQKFDDRGQENREDTEVRHTVQL